MSFAIETPASPVSDTTVAVRCDCRGSKKAAEPHPERGLTIRFGHGSRSKHQASVSPRLLLQLLSGADTPAEMLAYVRRSLPNESPGSNESPGAKGVARQPPDS